MQVDTSKRYPSLILCIALKFLKVKKFATICFLVLQSRISLIFLRIIRKLGCITKTQDYKVKWEDNF